MSEDIPTTIVLDNGSGMCKVGIAGDDAPLAIFPSIIGHPKHKCIMIESGSRSTYVGNEAQSKRGILNLKYPINHGIVTDWDAMQQIWHHAFYNELCLCPEEHSILLSETPLNPLANKQKMAQIIFETFNMVGMQVSLSSILSIFQNGRLTGVSCESGDAVSIVVPIYEGYLIPHAIQRLDYAGRDLTHILMSLLSDRGYSLTSSSEREIVRDIKEKFGFVALDFEQELKLPCSKPFTSEYKLPDGHVISLGNERFKCCEALFKPKLFGIDSNSIDQALYQSVKACSVDIRKCLLMNVILAGGTTCLRMFPERIEKELVSLCQGSHRIKIVSPPERRYSVWYGGSVLASLSTFQNTLITRSQYNEFGPNIFRK